VVTLTDDLKLPKSVNFKDYGVPNIDDSLNAIETVLLKEVWLQITPSVFTSLLVGVAEYCDEHLSVCCLSANVSPELRPNFTNHLWPWLGPPLEAL